MGSVSLRALDVVRQLVGVVAGTGVGRRILSSVLGAGVRLILRIRRRLGIWFWLGRLGRLWMVAHRAL